MAGQQFAVIAQPSLPGSFGIPVQFMITTTEPFDRLNTVAQRFLQEVQKSGMFIFVQTDLRIDEPQATVEIDRDKTSELGLTMGDIGSSMASLRPSVR